ncbi:MAG: CHAT domain-containing protein, partial [Thermodesulfovibrionia bacterium]|nr:CHAT domain-containing protein [Thermodesulfovibrionia bacterium]
YGRLMFDELIPINIKDRLIKTAKKNLMISIDDKLVYIPWELLYDGKEFICQRFSLGRSVSTKQQVSSHSRALGRPLKMQLLADPGGDLKASYEEGVEIKNETGMFEDWINVYLKSTDIKTDYVKAKIRNFDIVHYAGHAEHDSQNPAESGWMLSDGKLSAEEIISFTGAMPMPSLVFSNACQTGQTEEWRLEEDYEDRIFGLANAFLLSGVQHYIGTFWEIPDLAGSYFAIHFYKNLAKGVAIGEAMRLARIALINKYGEDTIVWASYMLYGDPTTMYVHPDMEVRLEEPAEKPVTEELVSPELRHKEEVIQIRDKRKIPKNTILTGIGLLLAVVLASVFVMWDRGNDQAATVTVERGITVKDKEESRKRINELVSSLADKYREGKFEQAKAVQDEWSSRPLTMVLMGIKSAETYNRDRLANMLPQVLQTEERVNIVEREVLDKLLEELELGTSSLADPLTSLKIGKLFSAKIIMTASILHNGKGNIIILRGIDTETTRVRKIISVESAAREIDADTINNLGRKIVEWIRADFPLKGRIVSVSGDKYQINLGQLHGLKKGDRLEILAESPDGTGIQVAAGEIEIDEVGKDKSWATVSDSIGKLKKGDRIREKQTGSI